jgi:signal transduction histidine kinase
LNLLNNASKYMDDGGRIWVTAEQKNEEIFIRVKDTGIGISGEMIPYIFDTFKQADQSRPRSQGGLGIGLSLARKLVEMHDGELQAFSEGIGHGSEFVVRLPTIAKPAAQGECASSC